MKRRVVKDGFTLVELLVVVAIIGILSGMVLVSMDAGGYFKRGRDSRRLADLATTQAALEQYYAQQGEYPVSSYLVFGSDFVDPDDATLIYLKSVPNDPDSTKAYEYCVEAGQGNYVVCADMESTPLPSDCGGATYVPCSKNCCLTNPF